MIATNHPPTDVDPGRDGSQGLTNAAYLVLVAAAGLIALWFGAARVESALAVTAAIWLALTLVLRPNWRVSGAALSGCVMAVLLVRNFPELPLDAGLWALACIVISLIGLRLVPVSTTPFFPSSSSISACSSSTSPRRCWWRCRPTSTRTSSPSRCAPPASASSPSPPACWSPPRWSCHGRCGSAPRARSPKSDPSAPTAPSPAAWVLIVVAVVASVVDQRARPRRLARAASRRWSASPAWAAAPCWHSSWFRGTLPLIHRIGLVGVALAIMVTGLGSGGCHQGAPRLSPARLPRSTCRRIPWALLVLATAVLVLANLSKSEFRSDRRAADPRGARVPKPGRTTSIG